MSERIPVVYILSSGHSGTTLLDLLLGAHPRVWTLGEAQILPWELKNPRVPCGCGEPIPEDSFWEPLLPRIPLDTSGYHIGYFRGPDQTGWVLRWNLLPGLLRGESPSRHRNAIEEYASNNYRYFKTVREAAEKRTDGSLKWLVDNSKDPYRLFWLQESDRFDLRVVHLVKDPRAFVYSMTKTHLPRALPKVVRFAGRWLVELGIMRQLCRTSFSKDQVQFLRYEDLAGQPTRTLRGLMRWLDLDLSEELMESFRDRENHAVSGNIMRWRNSETEIELDERWKQELPVLYQSVVNAMVRPFLPFFTYKLP